MLPSFTEFSAQGEAAEFESSCISNEIGFYGHSGVFYRVLPSFFFIRLLLIIRWWEPGKGAVGRCWNDASRSSCSRGRVIGVGFGLFIFCVSIDRLSIVIDIYRLLVSRFTSTTRCRLIEFDSLSMFFIMVVLFFRKTGNVVKSLKSASLQLGWLVFFAFLSIGCR